MIPKSFITEWRQHAPWISDVQVEQDLIISRALVELYSSNLISESLAFRGGTALYKLYSLPSPRYSEDIDLVQIQAVPIGMVISEIRKILNPWLGEPNLKKAEGRTTISYRFLSEGPPSIPMKLKIEINTKEHFSVLGCVHKFFTTNSTWFKGEAPIVTYQLEELMGTKLRALYQRKKGRDLFDLWYILKNNKIDIPAIINIFNHYLDQQGLHVTRAQFEQNLLEKVHSPPFVNDIRQLLSTEIEQQWSLEEALSLVQDYILPSLSGAAWKGIKTESLK